MRRSLTVKRVALTLAVVFLLGLAIGAGLSVVGPWMAGQSGPNLISLGETPAFAQSGSFLMQCSKGGEGAQGTPFHHCVLVNASTGHWRLIAFSFDEYGTRQWVGNQLGEGNLYLP